MTYMQKIRLLQRQEMTVDRKMVRLKRARERIAAKDAQLSGLLKTVAGLDAEVEEGNQQIKKLQARIAHSEVLLERSKTASKIMTAETGFARATVDGVKEKVGQIEKEFAAAVKGGISTGQRNAMRSLVGVMSMIAAGAENPLTVVKEKVGGLLAGLASTDEGEEGLGMPRLSC
jgi:chromosome segregation ATPase